MPFPKRTKLEGGEFTQVDFGEGKLLVQKNEIARFLNAENREIFLELEEMATETRKPQEKGALKLSFLHSSSDRHPRHYYKLSFAGEDYFVKKSPANEKEDFGGGATEVIAMQEAKKLLAGLQGVEVADYALGYQNKYSAYSFSKYNPALETDLEDYLKKFGLTANGKAASLRKRRDEIHKLLSPHFLDASTHNMAYDEKTDKIIVFDLVKKIPKQPDNETLRVD